MRNRIRGYGFGVCTFGETPLKVYRLDRVEGRGRAGEVLSADKKGLVVACGEDAVRFTELQLSGKKRMGAADFLNGTSLPVGTILR